MGPCMTFTQKMLIATDLSPASLPALDAGASLARRFGAEVTLLYVYDPALLSPLYMLPGGSTFAPSQADVGIFEKTVRDEMDKLASERLAGVEQVTVLIRQDPSAPEGVCACARALGSDLVVVGTHGRTGFRHVFIGSVAERVVRHAPCPVLTVRSAPAPTS